MRNEIKLRFNEPEYIIDRENGVVVCKLTFVALWPSYVEYGNYVLPRVRTVKAVARVGEHDVFDYEVGRKVSLAKAEQKAYRKIQRVCFKAIDECVKAFTTFKQFGIKAEGVINHNNKYIEKF